MPPDVVDQADPVYPVATAELERTVATPARPHQRLVWRYVAVVGTLVAAAIVSVGISEFWFSYEDSKRAVTDAEADKASSAAISIRQFIQELGDDLEGVANPMPGDPAGADRAAVLQEPLPASAGDQRADVSRCDRHGRACTRTPTRSTRSTSLTCGSTAPTSDAFRRARAEQRYFGPVTFSQRDGRPHMIVAVAEAPPGGGVIVADVDLESVVDAIRRAQIGTAGYAYAVDAQGQVIAHTTNLSLVLADTNLGALPQVRCRTGRHGAGPWRGHRRA